MNASKTKIRLATPLTSSYSAIPNALSFSFGVPVDRADAAFFFCKQKHTVENSQIGCQIGLNLTKTVKFKTKLM